MAFISSTQKSQEVRAPPLLSAGVLFSPFCLLLNKQRRAYQLQRKQITALGGDLPPGRSTTEQSIGTSSFLPYPGENRKYSKLKLSRTAYLPCTEKA